MFDDAMVINSIVCMDSSFRSAVRRPEFLFCVCAQALGLNIFYTGKTKD